MRPGARLAGEQLHERPDGLLLLVLLRVASRLRQGGTEFDHVWSRRELP
jgi:hypothetical protein